MNSNVIYNLTHSTNGTHEMYRPYDSAGEVNHVFYKYILPELVILGILSNAISGFVFRRQRLGQFSVGLYICVYACVNILTIIFLYGYGWLVIMAWVPDVQILSDNTCKIFAFLMRVMMYSGIWLLVASLVDRYIFIFHPERAVIMCQVFMAKVAVTIIFIGLGVVSVHAMWSYTLDDETHTCQMRMFDIHITIWKWMSTTCYIFLPVLVLSALTFTLIYGFIRPSTRCAIRNTEPLDLTVLVLSLSLMHIILTLPATVVNVVDQLMPPYDINAKLYQNILMAYAVSNIMVILNTVILFPLGVLVSPSFRQEIASLCSRTMNRVMRIQNNELKTTESGISENLVVTSHSNDTLL